MNYAICKVSIASIYKGSSQKSEMLSQLLFGEVVEVLEWKSDLMYVRCTWDDVKGWVLADQMNAIEIDDAIGMLQDSTVALSLVDNIMAVDRFIPITIGASLPHFDGVKGRFVDIPYQYTGSVIKPGTYELKTSWIEKLILRYMHAPELFGGRSPFGIDAAGLAQVLYKMLGINLFRNTDQQVTQGRTVDFMEFCQPGDLAFFDDGKGNIAHTGIILSDCSLVHVDGKVRKDKVDHFGIWNSETKKYTWQLRVVKRLLPDFPEDSMLSRMQEKNKLKKAESELLSQPGMFD